MSSHKNTIEPGAEAIAQNTQNRNAAKDETTIFGFWVYLMTDLVLFATLFATYAVLHNNTAGGEGAGELFSMPFVLVETLILLTSSFTCGLAMLALHKGNKNQVLTWFGVTFLLGLAFISMELYEFRHLVAEGHSWRESGFLSAFFTLVGTHGLHITIGLLWMGTLMYKLWQKGITATNTRRFTLLSLFWHFLDIVWIFIFTFVYLMGAI
jgi:cytochrome o ubiquinol oxidase subunit 3